MEDFDDIQLDSDLQEPTPKPIGLFGMMFGKMTSDMKFVGIFTIIYGGLSCLSIFGAVIGIPLIIAGLRLRESADVFNIFSASNDKASLKRGFELQGKYFNILKIMIIIGIVLAVIMFIWMIVVGISMFSALSGYDSYGQY